MTHERTVLLVVHTGREEATETARRVEKVLSDNNIGLRVLSAEAVDRGPSQLAPDDMRALGVDIEVVDADPDAAQGCELVVGLGGDGTFLRAAELARNAGVPVLGINLGRIGFLAEAETEAIDRVLEHVVARMEALLVVPNNAHALFARPMVTSPEARIAIEIEGDGHDALVFCDGRREMLVPAGARLEVRRCEVSVKWARLDSAPFTDRLVRKFRLPVTGWRGR
jgi:NAD kinase